MLLEILAPANLVTPGQSQEKCSLVPGNYFRVIFGSEYLAPEIGHFWQYLTFSDKNNNKEFNLFSFSIIDLYMGHCDVENMIQWKGAFTWNS